MPASRSLVRSSVVSILLGLSLVVPAAAQTPVNLKAAAQSAVKIRIDNFGKINANYFRGAQPEGSDYRDLAVLGVKTVIDLTADGDAAEARLVSHEGMTFFRIPMTTHETPTPEKIARFLEIVNNPANQPVYVHCQGGRHRTGVMTAVYRMTDEQWSSDRAFAEMKQYKFGADFLHSEFKDFVYTYQPKTVVAAATKASSE